MWFKSFNRIFSQIQSIPNKKLSNRDLAYISLDKNTAELAYVRLIYFAWIVMTSNLQAMIKTAFSLKDVFRKCVLEIDITTSRKKLNVLKPWTPLL